MQRTKMFCVSYVSTKISCSGEIWQASCIMLRWGAAVTLVYVARFRLSFCVTRCELHFAGNKNSECVIERTFSNEQES